MSCLGVTNLNFLLDKNSIEVGTQYVTLSWNEPIGDSPIYYKISIDFIDYNEFETIFPINNLYTKTIDVSTLTEGIHQITLYQKNCNNENITSISRSIMVTTTNNICDVPVSSPCINVSSNQFFNSICQNNYCMTDSSDIFNIQQDSDLIIRLNYNSGEQYCRKFKIIIKEILQSTKIVYSSDIFFPYMCSLFTNTDEVSYCDFVISKDIINNFPKTTNYSIDYTIEVIQYNPNCSTITSSRSQIIYTENYCQPVESSPRNILINGTKNYNVVINQQVTVSWEQPVIIGTQPTIYSVYLNEYLISSKEYTTLFETLVFTTVGENILKISQKNKCTNSEKCITQKIIQATDCIKQIWSNNTDFYKNSDIIRGNSFSLNCGININDIEGTPQFNYRIKQYYDLTEASLIYDFNTKIPSNGVFEFSQSESDFIFSSYPDDFKNDYCYPIYFRIFCDNCNEEMQFNNSLLLQRIGYIILNPIRNLQLSTNILYKTNEYSQSWYKPINQEDGKVIKYILKIRNLQTQQTVYLKSFTEMVTQEIYIKENQIPATLDIGNYQLEGYCLPCNAIDDININYKSSSTFYNFSIVQECEQITINPKITYPIQNSVIKNTQIVPTLISWEPTNGSIPLYDIYINGNKLNSISITDTTFSYGFYRQGNYTIKIVQENSCTFGNYSDEITVTVCDIPTKITPETPINMQFNVSVSPTFVWEDENTLSNTYYDFYLGTSEEALQLIKQNLMEKQYTYNAILRTGTIYYWKVIQKNQCGESINNNTYYFTTIHCQTVPSKPILKTPSDDQVGILRATRTFTWNFQSNQNFYDLYIGEQTLNDNELTCVKSNIQANIYSDTTILKKNTFYKWKIIQKSDCQQVTSDINTFRTVNCETHQNNFYIINPINNSENLNTTLQITWQNQETQNSIISYYEVYIGRTEASQVLINKAYTTTFEYQGQVDSEYYIFIKQVNDCGSIKSSNTVRVTTKKCLSQPTVNLIYPSNSLQNVSTNMQFTWSSINYSTFDIYIGNTYVLTESNIIKSDITSTNFQYLNLQQDSTYYWKVVQKNDCGTKSSEIYYFTTSTWNTQPEYISILTPQSSNTVISQKPTISWVAQGQDTFEIYISNMLNTLDTSKYQQNIKEYSYQFQESLLLNTTYFIKIRQINDIGYLDSNYISFTTLDCADTPSTPIITYPLSDSDNVIQPIIVEWIHQENQKTYDLYFGKTLDELENQKVSNIEGDSYELPLLEQRTHYYLKIQQKNNCGNSNFSNIIEFNTTNCIDIPQEITLIEPYNFSKNVNINNLRFHWLDQNLYNKNYTLYISKTNTFEEEDIIYKYENINSIEKIVNGLEIETNYYWKITLQNDCGIRESEVYRFTTIDCTSQPAIPQLEYPKQESTPIYNTEFKWNISMNQKHYDVYLKKIADTSYVKIQFNINTNKFIYKYLTQEEEYEWYVVQKNKCGNQESLKSQFKTVSSDCYEPTLPYNPYPSNNQTNIERNVKLSWKESIGNQPISYTIYLEKGNQNPTTKYNEFQYTKQDIKLFCKFSYGLEVETDRLTLMSFDTSPLESPELYPLLQTKLESKTSYERYFYIQQVNLQTGQKLKRFKVFQDKQNPFKGQTLYYRTQSINNYDLPKRGSSIQNGMNIIQEEPYLTNLSIDTDFDGEITENLQKTDFGILQLEITKNSQISGVIRNSIFIQYDEYMPDEIENNLDSNSVYYWRVEQQNECGKIEGPTWRFTTGS